MARQDYEIYTVNGAGGGAQDSDAFLSLGIQYATGNGVEHDLVAAHKWLNIAAIRGNRQALQHRREIAAEMTQEQIAAALKPGAGMAQTELTHAAVGLMARQRGMTWRYCC